jgi:hypothetical protein
LPDGLIGRILKREIVIWMALKSHGARAALSHLFGRLFGLYKYFLSASTIDFRRANLQPAASIEDFILILFPELKLSEINRAVSRAKKLVDSLSKKKSRALFAPKRWNSGKNLQYILTSIIILKTPDVIVETGKANGASAAACAIGIRENNYGHLWSFDINDIDPVLKPKNLRPMVSLVKTSGSSTELKNQISKISVNDFAVFLHDSDHSYFGQQSDYRIAEDLGFDLILSHDIDASLAFCDFGKNKGVIFYDAPKFIGGLRVKKR